MSLRLHTIPSEDGYHMPGEFELHEGCLMIWPQRPGSWIYGAKAAKEVFTKVGLAIARSEKLYMLASKECYMEAKEYLQKEAEKGKKAEEKSG